MADDTLCLTYDEWCVILEASEGDWDFLRFMMKRFFSGEDDVDEFLEEHGQARAA